MVQAKSTHLYYKPSRTGLSRVQAKMTRLYYFPSRARMEFPLAAEETLASLGKAPRDHAPLGHVAVLRQRIMALMVVPAGRCPMSHFNLKKSTHAL